MNLRDSIEYLQEYFAGPPGNEAETRECIIRPLLTAAGYAARDVKLEVIDQNKQRPDYTILPGEGELTWFLEAKAWRLDLRDEHINQALDYANHNGKRWVVLSNGQLWRLYDNAVLGLAKDKLVTEASLQDATTMEELLSALGPVSVRSGALTGYALNELGRRADEAVQDQLTIQLREAIADPESDLMRKLAGLFETRVAGTEPRHVSAALRALTEVHAHAPESNVASGGCQDLSPDTYNPKSPRQWTAYQAAAREMIERAIRETPGLTIDRTWKRGVLFLPASWDSILPATEVREWSPSGRTLLFELDVDSETSGLRLRLFIGPGPAERRAELFRLACQSTIIRPNRQQMSQKWDRVYLRFFVPQEYGKASADILAAAFRAEWLVFVGADLNSIKRTVLDGYRGLKSFADRDLSN